MANCNVCGAAAMITCICGKHAYCQTHAHMGMNELINEMESKNGGKANSKRV